MLDQPSIGDRALYARTVFGGTAASAQKGRLISSIGDSLILDGFCRVGNFYKLARGTLRIGERSIVGEFHGLGARL